MNSESARLREDLRRSCGQVTHVRCSSGRRCHVLGQQGGQQLDRPIGHRRVRSLGLKRRGMRAYLLSVSVPVQDAP